MKGKVTEVTVKRQESGRYEVSINVVLKRGLSYKRSEELLSEVKQKLFGKIIDLTIPSNQT